MAIIIFGASGFLGGALRAYFAGRGVPVTGTYTRHPQPRLVPCDLARLDLGGLTLRPRQFSRAIICSAVTDMDRCRTEWEATRAVNVLGVGRLLDLLRRRRIPPVFVSTDYVFDGRTGRYAEDDVRNPVLAYGRQKMEIEDRLTREGGDYLIVRLARLYGLGGGRPTILQSIATDLRAGRTLTMATDQVFSPTWVGDVCRALDLLIGKGVRGCVHVCAGEAVSRWALAQAVKDALGIETGRVVPCRLSDLTFADGRPPDTSLDNRKCLALTGLRFAALGEALAALRAGAGTPARPGPGA